CSNHTRVSISVHQAYILVQFQFPETQESQVVGLGFRSNRRWDLKLAQFHHYGGSNSLFYHNGQNSPTSFSWRDTRINCTMDVFYHSYQHEQATKWQKINDKEGLEIRMPNFANMIVAFCGALSIWI